MYEKLSDTFKGVAVKYLTRVDANPEKSNQHEWLITFSDFVQEIKKIQHFS